MDRRRLPGEGGFALDRAAALLEERALDVPVVVEVLNADWRERDLAVRAARLLQAHTGTAQGVDIVLDKRLPIGAGLGGLAAAAFILRPESDNTQVLRDGLPYYVFYASNLLAVHAHFGEVRQPGVERRAHVRNKLGGSHVHRRLDRHAVAARELLVPLRPTGLDRLEVVVLGLGALDACMISEEIAWGCTGIGTAMEANSLALQPVIEGASDACRTKGMEHAWNS